MADKNYVNSATGKILSISECMVCPYDFHNTNAEQITQPKLSHCWVIPNISAIKYRIKNNPIAKTKKSYYKTCLTLTIKAYMKFIETFDNEELTSLFKEEVKNHFL
jgi:hypothetical protein